MPLTVMTATTGTSAALLAFPDGLYHMLNFRGAERAVTQDQHLGDAGVPHGSTYHWPAAPGWRVLCGSHSAALPMCSRCPDRNIPLPTSTLYDGVLSLHAIYCCHNAPVDCHTTTAS